VGIDYGSKSQTKNQRQGESLVGVHIPQRETNVPEGIMSVSKPVTAP